MRARWPPRPHRKAGGSATHQIGGSRRDAQCARDPEPPPVLQLLVGEPAGIEGLVEAL
jgi:hypothetical protein